VAKTSGHTLSVILHLTPSLLPDHPVVCPLFLCSYSKSGGHVLAVCGAVANILHYLCPFLVSFSLKQKASTVNVKLSFLHVVKLMERLEV
jgi:uncharacterized membrane protein